MAAKKKSADSEKKIAEVTDEESKKEALSTTLASLEHKFGKGTIMRMGDSPRVAAEVISTGSLGLDIALGIGGLPRGRIVEIYGPESSGKTTLALHVVAEAQKAGGTAVFIDAEHALDPEYARALGVDVDNLLVSQPDSGEQALTICDALVRSAAVDVIVIDSVAALVPKKEIDGEMGDSAVGVQARLMSQAMRKLSGNVARTRCIVVFINQLREKVGIMYGNPETTTGGNALKYYSSVRLDIRVKERLTTKTEAYGNHIRCKVVKNKLAPPWKIAEFDILFGKGISKTSEILEFALTYEVIEKSGSWFSYNGQRIAQGRENAMDYLEKNPEIAAEIERTIRAKIEEARAAKGDIPLPESDDLPDEDDPDALTFPDDDLPPDDSDGGTDDL